MHTNIDKQGQENLLKDTTIIYAFIGSEEQEAAVQQRFSYWVSIGGSPYNIYFTRDLYAEIQGIVQTDDRQRDFGGMTEDIIQLALRRLLALSMTTDAEYAQTEAFFTYSTGGKEYELYVVMNSEGIILGFPSDF